MAKYKEIAAIQAALTANDTATAQTLLTALKTEMVGANNTTYTYKCTNCGLKCKIVSGCELDDFTFCLDNLKKGNGSFVQTDVSVAV